MTLSWILLKPLGPGFPVLGRVENFTHLDFPWRSEILEFVGDWSCGAGTELSEVIEFLLFVEGFLGLWGER